MKKFRRIVSIVGLTMISMGCGKEEPAEREAGLSPIHGKLTSAEGKVVLRLPGLGRDLTVFVNGDNQKPLQGVMIRVWTLPEHLILMAFDAPGKYRPELIALRKEELQLDMKGLSSRSTVVDGRVVIRLDPAPEDTEYISFSRFSKVQAKALSEAFSTMRAIPLPLSERPSEIRRMMTEGMEASVLIMVGATTRMGWFPKQTVKKLVTELLDERQKGPLWRVYTLPDMPGVVWVAPPETVRGLEG